VSAELERVESPTPRRPRPRKISRRARSTFLEALGSGCSVTHSAELAGFARQRFYELAEREPDFAEEWREAVEAGTDRLEDEAYRRGVEGWDEPVFRANGLVGHVRKYSDALLTRLLASRRQSWREGAQVQVTALAPQVEVGVGVEGGVSLGQVFGVLARQGAVGALPSGSVDVIDAESVEEAEAAPAALEAPAEPDPSASFPPEIRSTVGVAYRDSVRSGRRMDWQRWEGGS
jgi:hypothetical protein